MGYPATPVAERFAGKYVAIPFSGCWLWMDALDEYGYGRLQLPGKRTVKAHRVSYELHVGSVPVGKLVCHRCDVRCCVNPAHLYAGNWNDNVQDCIRRGRYVAGGKPHPGERNGRAKLTENMVREIRKRIAAGERRRSLASEFGLAVSAINRLVNRVTWRHVK